MALYYKYHSSILAREIQLIPDPFFFLVNVFLQHDYFQCFYIVYDIALSTDNLLLPDFKLYRKKVIRNLCQI